jgi:hypothetical protein
MQAYYKQRALLHILFKVCTISRRDQIERVFERAELQRLAKRRGISDEHPKWVTRLWVMCHQEANVSAHYHKELLAEYLKICGYTHEEQEKIDVAKCNFLDMSVKYNDIVAIDNIDEHKERVDRGEATEKDKQEINRWWFDNHIVDLEKCENKDETFTFWLLHKGEIKRKMSNIKLEKSGDDVKGSVFINTAQKRERMGKLCEILGIANSFDVGQNIARDVLEKGTEKILAMSKDLGDVFGLRFQGGKKDGDFRKAIDIINQVFHVWGFTEINVGARVRKRIDGKQVAVTDYIVEAHKLSKKEVVGMGTFVACMKTCTLMVEEDRGDIAGFSAFHLEDGEEF